MFWYCEYKLNMFCIWYVYFKNLMVLNRKFIGRLLGKIIFRDIGMIKKY